MGRKILGISAFYHDSAAAIVDDGEIIAAAQEERFTRKKNDPRFPRNAINYCLEEAFVEPGDLAAIAFYDHPLATLDRVVKSTLTASPRGEAQWLKAGRSILGYKAFVADQIRRALKTDAKIFFTEHHAAHAASTFFPSRFQKAAIITMDGVGEWATTTLGLGEDAGIRILKQIDYPHSLGLLYSAFTYYSGFKVNSGEYKLMGLAPYGKPVYADRIREKLIHVLPDGSFRLDMNYFGFLDTLVMTNPAFEELFGGPARKPESRITRREMDLAASVQKVTEEVVLRIARHAREITQCSNAVLAGGVAFNCVANGWLRRARIFDDLWIQPAAGDAGGALGAALLVAHSEFRVPRSAGGAKRDGQKGSYLGPGYSPAEIAALLNRKGYPHHRVESIQERAKIVAKALADGMIAGFFSGRMEFGPRALGARSILGDPRRPETQVVMNLKIKNRESFRPFAPAVLAEKCGDCFEMEGESPYMLFVAPVREHRRLSPKSVEFEQGDDDMLKVVRQARSDVPAITHVDYSARVQTVCREDKPDFYAVIEEFERLTGCPMIVNTSFNVRGEPIVCTPEDAYRCFMATEIDLLVLEDSILWKKEQTQSAGNASAWKTEYEPD
jgi:carbamoyltransferase